MATFYGYTSGHAPQQDAAQRDQYTNKALLENLFWASAMWPGWHPDAE